MARTNLCPNPALANNATGWFGGTGRVTGLTGFTRTTGYAVSAAGDPIAARGDVAGNTAYTFSAFLRPQITGDVEVQINWYNAGGAYVATSAAQTFNLPANTIVRVWVTATAPPTAASGGLVVVTPGGLGQLIWTQALYELGTELRPWFDGSSPGGAWTGTAGNSTSTIPDDQANVGTDSVALTDTGAVSTTLTGTDAGGWAEAAATAVVSTGSDSAGLVEAQAVERMTVTAAGIGDVVTEGIAPDVSKHASVAIADVLIEGLAVTVSKEVPAAIADVVIEGVPAFGANTAPVPADVVVEGLPVQVGKAGEPGASRALRPARVRPLGVRFLAQSILDGRWLSMELPVTGPEVTWPLSGPVSLSASFKPEIRSLRDLGLEPWGTWIHCEEAGEIRGSGIMLPTTIGRDGTLSLRAAGPSYYASKVPWRGKFEGVEVDPAAMVKMMWDHIQSFPRGNLGVTVSGATPIRIGTEARDVDFVTGEGEVVSFTAGPYKLNWWENKIIGSEIDKLGTETPFDMVESSRWNADKTDVDHSLAVAYPQAGQRIDRAFVQGQNILEVGDIEEPNDAYADTVYVLGKGEGPDAVVGEDSWWVGNRLRLPALVDDKTIDNSARAKALARTELAARLAALIEIPEIVIDSRHPNAPIGSFAPGDEILPVVHFPYLGWVRQWHRVTAIRYLPFAHRAVVSLTRRAEFSG